MSKVKQFFDVAKKVGLVKDDKYISGIPNGKSEDISGIPNGKSEDVNLFYILENSLGYPQPIDVNNYLNQNKDE
jgi:hypothetical protein